MIPTVTFPLSNSGTDRVALSEVMVCGPWSDSVHVTVEPTDTRIVGVGLFNPQERLTGPLPRVVVESLVGAGVEVDTGLTTIEPRDC